MEAQDWSGAVHLWHKSRDAGLGKNRGHPRSLWRQLGPGQGSPEAPGPGGEACSPLCTSSLSGESAPAGLWPALGACLLPRMLHTVFLKGKQRVRRLMALLRGPLPSPLPLRLRPQPRSQPDQPAWLQVPCRIRPLWASPNSCILPLSAFSSPHHLP